MKYAIASLILVGSMSATASAAEFQLKAGSWQLQEGIGLDQKMAGQSRKSICVKEGETQADTNWLITLAQPRTDCNSKLVSQTASRIRVDFSCPMNGHTLKGPSTITLNPDRITIQNDLALDLPYAPLAMGQTKSVFHVSNQCQ